MTGLTFRAWAALASSWACLVIFSIFVRSARSACFFTHFSTVCCTTYKHIHSSEGGFLTRAYGASGTKVSLTRTFEANKQRRCYTPQSLILPVPQARLR